MAKQTRRSRTQCHSRSTPRSSARSVFAKRISSAILRSPRTRAPSRLRTYSRRPANPKAPRPTRSATTQRTLFLTQGRGASGERSGIGKSSSVLSAGGDSVLTGLPLPVLLNVFFLIHPINKGLVVPPADFFPIIHYAVGIRITAVGTMLCG